MLSSFLCIAVRSHIFYYYFELSSLVHFPEGQSPNLQRVTRSAWNWKEQHSVQTKAEIGQWQKKGGWQMENDTDPQWSMEAWGNMGTLHHKTPVAYTHLPGVLCNHKELIKSHFISSFCKKRQNISSLLHFWGNRSIKVASEVMFRSLPKLEKW